MHDVWHIRTASGWGNMPQKSLRVPTYSGACANCTIANIKQALKACYKFKYKIKRLNPFWIRVQNSKFKIQN